MRLTNYALAFASLPTFARLMRSRVLSERERDYVLSARCIGAPDARIMGVHVLPNAISPLIVQISLTMAFAVLAESALSFLGLGTQPPQPSWLKKPAHPGIHLAAVLFGLQLPTLPVLFSVPVEVSSFLSRYYAFFNEIFSILGTPV